MEKLFYKLHRYFKADYHLAVLDMDAGKRWLVKPEARKSKTGFLSKEMIGQIIPVKEEKRHI